MQEGGVVCTHWACCRRSPWGGVEEGTLALLVREWPWPQHPPCPPLPFPPCALYSAPGQLFLNFFFQITN